MLTKLILVGCLLGVTILSVTAADEDNPELLKIPEITRDMRYDQVTSERVAQSVMNFAHDLAVAIDTNEYPNTQIFSPLSVMSSLSILHMGAYGRSYNQLNRLFATSNGLNGLSSAKVHEEFGWLLEDVMTNRNNKKRPRMDSPWRSTPFNPNNLGKGGQNTPTEHTVRVANALFVQKGFSLKPDYAFAAQSVYKSEVTPLDFKRDQQNAKDYINSWVNQNTLGKIPIIINDELRGDTNMILASTLYFKGFWEQPFLASGTAKANFYPDGPESMPVRIQMMGVGGVFPFYDAPEYDCRIIGLPYKGNQTTMYIIQPNDSTRLKLQQLQKMLTGEKINEMISKMEHKTGVVAFPKFHVPNTLHLKAPLTRMGFGEIFQENSADFSLIADPDQNQNQQVQAAASSPSFSQIPIPVHEQLNFGEIMARPAAPVRVAQKAPKYDLSQGPLDRYQEQPLIFSRFGGEMEMKNQTDRLGQINQMQWTQQGDLMIGTPYERSKRAVTYKVESEFARGNTPLRLKHLILNKRITKTNPGKKLIRNRREVVPASAQSLQRLDQMRSTAGLKKPQLYVDDILHKVDFNVNEQGTEAAAVTLTFLRRSGTDVAFRCDTPFLILIRQDLTKLPLFYGIVNIPAQ
ncbi:serine protease inhibitor 28Dc-like [Eupeodes corollae]|uniref:serine protease inhibitor 28Dc-like n=1 Tax=Eupeodes corollae TaxID=290404 RepID=UPI002493495B|nr:serine protease inhibitor 28Dc-like [Eupeodes corollae]XP_055915803.1 serine protease inhibitor 28Dc-like [Eupeodes corollae]XP_055915804.1 serine protease inhibitor 28Dc-like [Eupeodes corollae]